MKLLRDLASKVFSSKKAEPVKEVEHTPIKTVKKHRAYIKKKASITYIDRMSIKDAKDKTARRKANKVSRKSRAINKQNI